MKRMLALLACLAALAAGAQERAITARVVVPAPLGAVWEAWTTSEGIKSFFAPDAKVEARVDGPFEVYMNPYGPPGLKGADGMRFLAVEPRSRITFTWIAPPTMPNARKQRTYVTVRFKPTGEKTTEVSLYHGGWGEGPEWDRAFAYHEKAWSSILTALEQRFAQGPMDWSAVLERLRGGGPAK